MPGTNINLFIEKFNEVVEQLKTNYELVLVGDYNIDMLKNDTYKNNFSLYLQSNYLIPVITEVTRISTKEKDDGTTTTSKTLIDNIFIKANTNHISGVIDTRISDHFSVFVSLPLLSKDDIQNTQIKFRLMNGFTKRKFNCQLLQSSLIFSVRGMAR